MLKYTVYYDTLLINLHISILAGVTSSLREIRSLWPGRVETDEVFFRWSKVESRLRELDLPEATCGDHG